MLPSMPSMNKMKKYGVYGGLIALPVGISGYLLYNWMAPTATATPATAPPSTASGSYPPISVTGGSKKTRRNRGDKPSKHTKSKKH